MLEAENSVVEPQALLSSRATTQPLSLRWIGTPPGRTSSSLRQSRRAVGKRTSSSPLPPSRSIDDAAVTRVTRGSDHAAPTTNDVVEDVLARTEIWFTTPAIARKPRLYE